jgi:hypothetical protein
VLSNIEWRGLPLNQSLTIAIYGPVSMARLALWQIRIVMPLTRSHRWRLLRARALWLAAGTAIWLVANPAAAQEKESPLRGELTEREVMTDLGRADGEEKRRKKLKEDKLKREREAIRSRSKTADEDEPNPDDASSGSTLFPDKKADAQTMGETEEPAPAPRARQAKRKEAGKKKSNVTSEATGSVEEDNRYGAQKVEGFEAAATINEDDQERNDRVERENGRAEAIEGLDKKLDDNPYAPLGMRLGSFNVITTLEQGITATDNANYSSTPKGAVLSETTLRLNAVSDWSRHQAQIIGYGTYRKSVSGEEVEDPSAGIDGTLNIDINHDLRAIAKASYNLRRETASSPVVLPPNVSRPLRHELNGSIGLQKDLGKFRVTGTTSINRLAYGDADTGGGGTLSQQDRNSTLYSGALRLGYEVSPALTPFVEAEIGRRNYDLRLDAAGYERSSNQIVARAGVELDFGEKLNGEVSVGWINESFDDSRLIDASGLTTAARLAWSPERGTVVNFDASTTVEGTTTAGESGSILYASSIGVERQIRSNLSAAAALSLGYRDYIGLPARDLTMSAETSATWWMNRYVGLKGRYRYEQVSSTLPNRDSQVNSVFLGLTLQK